MLKFSNGSYFLFTIFENIDEKIALGDMHNKLNYSYMLICSLSHELFTPINHLLNGSQSLIDNLVAMQQLGVVGTGDQASLIKMEAMNKCVTDANLLNSIGEGLNYFVQNILDFAKYINRTLSISTADVKLVRVLDMVSKLFKIKAERKKLSFIIQCDKDMILNTDGEKLAGLLYIFLDNSIKYTHKGGVRIEFKPGNSSDMIRIEIIDTGIGIDQEDMSKITSILENPFSDLRTEYSAGIGIGFRVAQVLIMYLAAGDVTLQIQSRKGEGTTIGFEILRNARKVDNEKLVHSQQKNISTCTHKSDTEKEFEVQRLLIKVADSFLKIAGRSRSTDINYQKLALRHLPLLCESISIKKSPSDHLTNRRSIYSIGESGSPINQKIKKVVTASIFLKALNLKEMDSSNYSNFQLPISSISPIGRRVSRNTEPELSPTLLQLQKCNSKLALIVDDDIFNNEYLRDILESFDFKTVSAYDGENAVELCMKFLTWNRQIDIVFMDYSMSTMNGDECTRKLRTSKFNPILEGVPIVGVTAHHDTGIAKKCIDAGMNCMIYKPISRAKIELELKKYKVIPEAIDSRSDLNLRKASFDLELLKD